MRQSGTEQSRQQGPQRRQRAIVVRDAMDQYLQEIMRSARARGRLTADLLESADGDAYVIRVPLPGRQPDEITIEATANTLTVSTQPRQDQQETGRRYLRREHAVGSMSRIFEFPADIDTDNVKATLEHGMLEIRVPKAAAAQRKVIQVRAA